MPRRRTQTTPDARPAPGAVPPLPRPATSVHSSVTMAGQPDRSQVGDAQPRRAQRLRHHRRGVGEDLKLIVPAPDWLAQVASRHRIDLPLPRRRAVSGGVGGAGQPTSRPRDQNRTLWSVRAAHPASIAAPSTTRWAPLEVMVGGAGRPAARTVRVHGPAAVTASAGVSSACLPTVVVPHGTGDPRRVQRRRSGERTGPGTCRADRCARPARRRARGPAPTYARSDTRRVSGNRNGSPATRCGAPAAASRPRGRAPTGGWA